MNRISAFTLVAMIVASLSPCRAQESDNLPCVDPAVVRPYGQALTGQAVKVCGFVTASRHGAVIYSERGDNAGVAFNAFDFPGDRKSSASVTEFRDIVGEKLLANNITEIRGEFIGIVAPNRFIPAGYWIELIDVRNLEVTRQGPRPTPLIKPKR